MIHTEVRIKYSGIIFYYCYNTFFKSVVTWTTAAASNSSQFEQSVA